jgi:hypothetical protein
MPIYLCRQWLRLFFAFLILLLPVAAIGAVDFSSWLGYEAPLQPFLPDYETPNPWFVLQSYQRTMTRQRFEYKLKRLYDPFNMMSRYLRISDQRVVVYPDPVHWGIPQFSMEFAPSEPERAPLPRSFRTPEEIRNIPKNPDHPLEGLRVAIDPGHIGGQWADMEGRSTRYQGGPAVKEGDLNLITAEILKKQLLDLGAEVYVVRESKDPVTPYRPEDFKTEARQIILGNSPKLAARLQSLTPEQQDKKIGQHLTDLADFLFYRSSEISERGNKIKNNFRPDITITLYLDATRGSGRGRFTDINRNIFFVHGSYTAKELEDPSQRLHLFQKLLEDAGGVELQVAVAISDAFIQMTHFPAVLYGDSQTTRLVVPDNFYVVARNLAANRDYDGPVVCTEPYFMNHPVTCQRLLAGDYEGTKVFGGKPYRSIFRDYADGVLKGLLSCYGPHGNP